ncbi:uncharacterized protein EURHEDRAFT_409110 [Aspergillus ruber CBS 135680]|uniref:Uncharacterized protein n=1 Tax=Aspergillus ruber (strain CBS 135680) TaxID=1388766 RepID=A0A017SLI6_ASPRC|nr:uncharacterized protein EURHEDRAFT_409110 [Aspergillus ruber CBS 135680]EYE97838.1 hypothetical protein EURHEDRAFT_409110 [Aspergillus ruber CBS 135680]
MPPTFHMNNFKPWAHPLESHSHHANHPIHIPQEPEKSPRPKPHHDSLPSTLSLPSVATHGVRLYKCC